MCLGLDCLLSEPPSEERAADESYDVWVAPGALTSTSTGDRNAIGGELTVMVHRAGDRDDGVGGYLQLESVSSGGWHASFGMQRSLAVVGLEAGFDLRTGRTPNEATSVGLRFAPFISIGVAYVSASMSYLPLATDSRSAQGLVFGLTAAIKLPFMVATE